MKRLKIKYKLIAPVSHIGEVASTGSYFQTIKTASGRLPIITANSVRGTLRDCSAKFLLDCLNCKVDKEIFHILFSGGNLNGNVKMDVGKAKAVREHLPMVSVFGGGLGDMILAGKMAVGNIYPICKESYDITGLDSDISWKNLIEEIEYTRTDDGKNDVLVKYIENPEAEKTAKASTQMRYSVQYLAAGTELTQEIILYDNVTDLEIGALMAAFREWFAMPKLGGMANKGFGFFDAETNFGLSVEKGEVTETEKCKEMIRTYQAFVESEGEDCLLALGRAKNGKK